MEITIAREDPRNPEIVKLLSESDAYHARLYPGEINYLMSADQLVRDEATLYGARLNGKIRGCAALLMRDSYSEIKRMFVSESARGMGLGKRLLERIEQHAREHEQRYLRLETGRKQHEAISLYRSLGYEEIEPFAPYVYDSLSLFMEKQLGLLY